MFEATGLVRRGHTTTSYSFERSSLSAGTTTSAENLPLAGIVTIDCAPPKKSVCFEPSAVPRSTTPTCTPAGCVSGTTPDTAADTVIPAVEADDTEAEPETAAPGSSLFADTTTETGCATEAAKANSSFGAKVAVTAWVPTASVETESSATPASVAAWPRLPAAFENVTVPAAAGATVAVSLVVSPSVIEAGAAASVVVVASATAGGNTASHCSEVIVTGTCLTTTSAEGLPCAYQTSASYEAPRVSKFAGIV